MIIYFYEIGYSDYEASPVSTLCHVSEFTQDEFNEMVLNCHVKVSKEKEIKHNKWLDTQSEDDKAHYKYYPRVGDLSSGVIGLMISDYGFTEPTISASFVADDTADIVPHEDSHRRASRFGDTYCDKLKLLRERFNVIEPRDNKIDDIING